ncbi:hypothetical protein, partial [Porphyromonas gulae]|uniref:hypothetical protein n=1 Tax=Porphyromonas gulae TaxID=111105 RepID=UPI00057DED49
MQLIRIQTVTLFLPALISLFEGDGLPATPTIFLIFAPATGGLSCVLKDRQHFDSYPLILSSSIKNDYTQMATTAD